MKLNRKTLIGIVVLVLATSVTMNLNVKIAHTTVHTITLSSPIDNAHSKDHTPDFVFIAISDNVSTINCTVYVGDIASGDIQATNDTSTTLTCNRTLTVSEDPLEWYINATDEDGTYKSSVRNIYIVPSTGPIDIPDTYDHEEEQETEPRITVKEIAGIIVLVVIVFMAVKFNARNKGSNPSRRRG